MRHATVRQLQVFVEAAHCLSFARVSERLHLTPAAVSFQIKQLETLTKLRLFERHGKGVRLTDAGRLLLAYAETVIKALGDADEVLTSLKGLKGGRVTVGMVSTGIYVMPHVLTRFHRRHPEASIRLVDGNRREILDLLVKGDIDIAVMGRAPQGVDVEARPFAPHPTVLIAAPSHPLVGRRRIPVAELASEAFIYREDGSGTRDMLETFFNARGVTPRVAMTTSSNETMKQAVMAGMGIAGISQHTVGLELGLGMLKRLSVDGLPLMRSWYVAHRRGMPLMPLHERLRDFILGHGRHIISGLQRSHRAIPAEGAGGARPRTR